MKNEIILENIPCSLCNSNDDKLILTGSDLLHGLPGEFKVVKCNVCGLMRTNPRPTSDSIGYYYPDDYGPYVGTKVQDIHSPPRKEVGFKKLIRSILSTNSKKIPSLAPGNMLEIGCASGSFLHEMASQDWKVQGIEFSKKAAQSAIQLGYPVHIGSLEDAPQISRSYDLIVGWMVLEHLHDPVAGLKKLRDCSNPNSWLALSVPNAASLEFKVFKDKWHALQLPSHLHHFTPDTLERTLEAGGWRLEKKFYQRNLNSLVISLGYTMRSLGYEKIGEKLINSSEKGMRLTYVLFPLAWLLSLFGETGRMTVWAKPKK